MGLKIFPAGYIALLQVCKRALGQSEPCAPVLAFELKKQYLYIQADPQLSANL